MGTIIAEGDWPSYKRPEFWRYPPKRYPLKADYKLFNNFDRALVASLSPDQQDIAALLLTHVTDEAIIAQLGVDLHAIQVVIVALDESIRECRLGIPYLRPEAVPNPLEPLEPLPRWPHVGPWWKFWGQPTPEAGGRFPCLGCYAIYRLIWIEDQSVTSGSIACPSCGREIYSWHSPHQFRVERVDRSRER